MDALLAFALGLLVGLLVGWLASRLLLLDLPSWTIGDTCLQADGQVRIEVSVPASTPAVEFVRFHSQVFHADPGTVPAPGMTAAAHGNSSPLTSPGPGGASTSTDCVVVWAEFKVFDVLKKVGLIPDCSGGGSNGPPPGARERFAPAPPAGEFEAIPRAYRVSPETPPPGAGGPVAELVGNLNRDRGAILEYVPDASTPVEPVWQARGGPGAGVRWTLCLLHRRGGVGAVLSIVAADGGREVRFTWVTSDWRFHTANRLTCEADEPGAPALLVRPA